MAKKWTKKLSELAEEIGKETHTMTPGGDMLTKDEMLVRQIWDEALGWTEKTKDDKGNDKEVKHKPQRWAKELLWSRREGAIPSAAPDDGGQHTAAKEVGELARNRLNTAAGKKDDKSA